MRTQSTEIRLRYQKLLGGKRCLLVTKAFGARLIKAHESGIIHHLHARLLHLHCSRMKGEERFPFDKEKKCNLGENV